MTTLDRPTVADQPPFLIRVFVPGTPKPQGSKRAIVNQHTGKASLIESSAGVKTWRDDIRAAMLDAPPLHFDGPVAVHCEFVLARRAQRGQRRPARGSGQALAPAQPRP